MEQIRCVAIDDEQPAIRIIERYTSKIKHFVLVGKFTNPAEALVWMNDNPFHVLFLDISMPQFSGLELVQKINCKPMVIFITAYSEFAANAFDLDAVDYLLKPFSFERFAKALTKATDWLQVKSFKAFDITNIDYDRNESFNNGLSIRCEGKMVKVAFNEIIYIQSYQEYISIYTQNNRFFIYERLKNIEKILPADKFYRVHRSFIVCVDKIRSFSGNLVEVGGHEIPVSRVNRDELLKKMEHV